MLTKTPRFYQEDTVAKIASHKERMHAGNKSTKGIVHWATGLGKSYFAMLNIFHNYPLEKHRNIFMAPAVNLVHQFAQNAIRDIPNFARTYQNGVTEHAGVGTVMANINHADARLIVGSVPTLIPSDEDEEAVKVLSDEITLTDVDIDRFGGIRRSKKSKRPYLISPRFDEILVHGLPSSITFDEAHHAIADQTMKMFFRLGDIQKIMSSEPIDIIGLSATPIRGDGRAMKSLFDVFYDIRTTAWAQEQGYLVPFSDPPAMRLTIDTGSDEEEMKHITNWDQQIYEALKDMAAGRQILIFMDKMPGYSRVDSSKHLARFLSEKGFPTAHTDGSCTIDEHGNILPTSARYDVYQRFMKKEFPCITSYGVGLEGLDLPVADCVVIFRRTKERYLIIQMIGRILRPHPGKTDAFVIDGVGRSIDISPIGSMMGWKVTAEGLYEEDTEELDEEDQIPSVEMAEPVVERIGHVNIYTPTQIKSKSSERWYDDPRTGRWYIGINDSGDAFCIQPPDFVTLAMVHDKLEVIAMMQNKNGNPYSLELNPDFYELYERLKQKTDEELQVDLANLQYLETYYDNYTLWWLNTKQKHDSLRQKNYLAANQDQLAVVMESSLMLDAVPHVTKAFINKRNQSFAEAITYKQHNFIKQLGAGDRIYEGMTKGDASGLITATLLNPKMDELDRIFEEVVLQV